MAKPRVLRIYRGRIMTMRAIALESGLHKRTIERHARLAQDLTNLVWCSLRKEARRKAIGAAIKRSGLRASTYSTRRWRGWTNEEAELIPLGMR